MIEIWWAYLWPILWIVIKILMLVIPLLVGVAYLTYAEDSEFLRSPKIDSGNLEEDNILKKIDKGLYLSNLHYLNWSDNLGGRITGMTRYACFWVENGEFVAPIENMRFDDSIYNFFGKQLDGIADTIDYIPDVGTYGGRQPGGIMAPSILIDGFNLTL